MDFSDFILPRLCCGCGHRIAEPNLVVCRPCLARISPLYEPICVRCGCPDARVLEPGKCANCPPAQIWFARARAAAPFSGMAQEIVFRLKYNARPEYATVMAEAMVNLLKTPHDTPLEADIVVPVPLHSARLRHRGFNQSAEIGRRLSKELGLQFAPRALSRIKPTVTQTRLKQRARRRNVENAFRCKRPGLVQGRRVLLVDDVYTTGSTLNECARILVGAGAASVDCIAYARAVMD